MNIFHKIILFLNSTREWGKKQLQLYFNLCFIKSTIFLLILSFFFSVFTPETFAATFQANYLSTDVNGVKSYDMISDYNGDGHHVLRILEPNNPAVGVKHTFIYVLPVEEEGGIIYGDGLETLRSLNAHNQYNATIIAPSFKIYPWYADHATDPNYRYESFMTLELQPWVKANIAISGNEQHWLLGFSKSGYGGMSLLMKHPDLFTLGAFWDFPADMSLYTSFGANTNYGTQANFDNNYRLSSLFVENHKASFLSDNRLWISGYGFFQTDVANFDSLLSTKGIKHTTAAGVMRTHAWNSGWVPSAVVGLSTNSIVAPDVTNISSGSPSNTSATITWSTNKDSSSKVDYGISPGSYTSSSSETDISTRVSYHSITLSSLLPCTSYFYRVRSKNSILNETTSSENSFITSGCVAASSVQANDNRCHDEVGIQPPWLYGAIAQDSTSILLYFTEAAQPVNKYAIEYGLSSNDYIYGADNLGIKSESRMTYLVKDLNPNTTYYFKVQGGNGCKGGEWSNEFKASTKSTISFKNLPLSSSKLEAVPTEIKPAINKITTQKRNESSHQVNIKVLNEENKPVKGAKVTFHSKVQEAITDKNGLAVFNNVEIGDHTVLISYTGFEKEQKIHVAADAKEFSLVIKVKEQSVVYSQSYLWSLGILGVALILIVIFFQKRKK